MTTNQIIHKWTLNRKFLIAKLTILFFSIFAFFSCNKDESPVNPAHDKIIKDPYVKIFNINIGTKGGEIKIPGGPLDGFKIDVPAGSYSTDKEFIISTATIKSHSFGQDFNPITPLIRINNGGDYADFVMTLTIPCKVPSGHFAMGFYFDEETGELEGIPVVAINVDHVILATRHFASKHLNETKGSLITRAKNWADILVSSVAADKLFGQQESGFRPGIDDWEFANNGSYIASSGHCTGQALTAMWYYHVQKLSLKGDPLYNKYDQIPGKMWQDNRNGYRFCSVVWADQDPVKRNAWLNKFDSVGTQRFSRDSLHYLAFAYSIHITQKPQLVEVWSGSGGHAMIIYKTNGGILSVADPNFPSKYSQFITLSGNGNFNPYVSKQDANSPDKSYYWIDYVAKSALFSFEKVSSRFEEMKKGTIGEVEPNTFPAVTLLYFDGKEWQDLPDTLSTDFDSLIIAAKCIFCNLRFPGDLTEIQALNRNGDLQEKNDENGYLKLKINKGEQEIPLYIQSEDPSGELEYLDFKVVVIRKEPMANFSYWLAELDRDGNTTSHFGIGTPGVWAGGKWQGLNYIVDSRKDYHLDDNHITVFVKLNAQLNAGRNLIESYNTEVWYTIGGTKFVTASMDGINLLKYSEDENYYKFGIEGTGVCSSLTRVSPVEFAKLDYGYKCDDQTYLFITLPKP